MKIRNEPEYFAATFQSIFNWNDIRIGFKRANKPNDEYFDGELRDGLARSLRQHFPDVSSTNIKENNSKYCVEELNVWDVCSCNSNDRVQTICCEKEPRTSAEKRRTQQQQQQQQKQKQQQQQRRTLPTTFIMYYLLYKLKQLCLVIVLLLPFLITYNTLIQEANGQEVMVPVSIQIPMSISNSNSNLNSINKLRLRHKLVNRTQEETQTNHVQLQEAKSGKECNNNSYSQSKLHNNNNNKTNNNKYNNNINKNHSIKSRYPIYSYNHRLNGYSLIILSQSANNLYSEMAKTSNKSLNTIDAPPKSAIIGNGNGSTIRTKRYIDNANSNNTQTHENKRKHETDSQILKVAFDKHKDQNNHNIINKEKLTKLVMTGLGLKKLPDMKKANISQLEYSSKYIEYLERLRKNHERKQYEDPMDFPELSPKNLQIFSIVTNSFSDITRKRWRHKRAARATESRERKSFRKSHNLGTNDKTNILLHFPLTINDAQFHYEKINEANVRLMMLYNPALAAQSQRRVKTKETGAKGSRRKQAQNNRHHNDNPGMHRNNCNNYDDCAILSSQQQYNRRAKMRTIILNLKVFQLLPKNKRLQLDVRKIEFESSNYGNANEETRSQWLEFDVTEAVRGWLNKSHENLGIEIQCDKCRRVGARILSDVSTSSTRLLDQNERTNDDIHDRFQLTPVLNIIGHIGRTHRENAVDPFNATHLAGNQSDDNFYHRFSHGHHNEQFKNWPNSCFKPHQRCCRHRLDVAFKDVKGFEFIIQPKIFDAGYCIGRCPPRHNPAHHHALLQSLIWQQDHNRAPRPCCAPSKLTELEILHVDEEHSDKLKISTWNDMQVLECACS